MNRLTSRERLLICFLGGATFLFGNLLLFDALAQRHARLRADVAAKRAEIKSMQALTMEAEAWAGREEWLRLHQPKLTNPEQAGVQLLEETKEIARANEVLLESPELGGVEAQPFCRQVSVSFNAKCTWPNLVKFLHGLQTPERFVVLETATLQVDPSNASRMSCRFKIAKCYAL